MIDTPRLRIREFVDADFLALLALVSDPKAMRFSDGIENAAAARKRLAGYRSSYRERCFGKWAVEEKTSGRFIGYCGFGIEEFDHKLQPELGFRFLPSSWGSGFATESAMACSHLAFANLGFDRYLGFAHPENHASRRVLEKLGMQLVGPRNFHGGPVIVYEQTNRPDE